MPGGRKPGTRKTGGRKKGTPNKSTDETRELIEKALGGSPLVKMANLVVELLDGTRTLLIPIFTKDGVEGIQSEAKAIEFATKLLSELAQYHSPKRKAIEMTHELGDRTASTLADLMQRAASDR
jgi:hypothetical protein